MWWFAFLAAMPIVLVLMEKLIERGSKGKRTLFMKLVKVEPFQDGDVMITVTTATGERKYVGDCTVWHRYPSGKRAGTMTESRLSDFWTAWKWRQRKEGGKR